MRDAAGHLAPRRGLLRTQHLAIVFEHQHETGADAAFQGRYCYAEVLDTLVGGDFQLHRAGAGALRTFHQVADFGFLFAEEQVAEIAGVLYPGRRKDVR